MGQQPRQSLCSGTNAWRQRVDEPLCTRPAQAYRPMVQLAGAVPRPGTAAHSRPYSCSNSKSSTLRARTCCAAKPPAAAAAALSVCGVVVDWQWPLQLEPQAAFVSNLVASEVLLPILGGWLFVAVLSAVASRARQWCDENPDEPLSLELLGLLPVALEGPTRVAVALCVTTRVLRNVAAGLHDYVHTFKPQWDHAAEAAARSVIHWLGPFDSLLLRLYTVVAVLATARVLIKWKTIALEFLLRQRAGLLPLQHSPAANMPQPPSKHGRKTGSAPGSSSSSSSSSRGAPRPPSPAAVGADKRTLSSVDGENDVDEVGVIQRDGSMLAVTMRPRSSAGGTAGEPAGAGTAAKAAIGGWAGSGGSSGGSDGSQKSSGSGPAEQHWVGLGAPQDDAVERLLLPLDSILSWAMAVMAGLFAVQILGINIQPLLAVGGASSLLIGLATQTLLTNAVMGVSIFLSRPFVPGDSITVQASGHILVSGVVERVTPMRTLLRTDDDVLVTLPNKTIADMIVYNKSRREARSRLAARTWERPFLKFKVKLPQKELQHLQVLQQDLLKVLKRPGVAQQTVEVALSKFTDAGAEVLLQCLLLVAVGSPMAQQLLLDLAATVRKHGATLVSIL